LSSKKLCEFSTGLLQYAQLILYKKRISVSTLLLFNFKVLKTRCFAMEEEEEEEEEEETIEWRLISMPS
jgi:hypothetical protein